MSKVIRQETVMLHFLNEGKRKSISKKIIFENNTCTISKAEVVEIKKELYGQIPNLLDQELKISNAVNWQSKKSYDFEAIENNDGSVTIITTVT